LKRIAFLGRGVHTIPTYRALLNKLAENYSIVVYSEVSGQPEWMKLDHRYTIRFFKSMSLPRRIRELLFVILMIREHLKTPFDLIHAHSTFPTGFAAVILQKLFGIPVIVSLDGGEASSFPDLQFGDAHQPRRATINKWVINQANVVTALTNFQRNEVYKNFNIKKEIKIITRGVDLNKFSFCRNKKKGLPVIFLSVGYLSRIKDPETLIKAFFMIQQQIDSQLIHLGKDYMNGLIHQMVKELGISERVRFVEAVDYDSVHEYYEKADILLHTARFESQGMVVAEAMASGTLVCGTHVGLMSDLSGECCITAPPKNAEAMAAAVLDLLNNPEVMAKMRMKAYDWSASHSLDHCVKEFETLYSQLIKS
jgi:glycosyltransferase involved in cell wall biosynthesis